jgi:hypothetical protein
MVIMIDIDGTVCAEGRPCDRPLATPLAGAVERINAYTDAGHVIVFWSGRGWDEYLATKQWLDEHGFRYAQLLMGKPIVNLIIDDRARRFEGWDKDYLSGVVLHGSPHS